MARGTAQASRRGRPGALLVLVCLGLLALPTRAAESVRYVITVDPARAPLVDVEMELTGFGADQVLVGIPFGYAAGRPDGDCVENLTAVDLAGRSLAAFTVDGHLYGWESAPRRVAYSVRLTHRSEVDGLARLRRWPCDGRTQPYVGRDRGLLVGGALLLVPDRWELDATVELRLPPGWATVSPWPCQNGIYRPQSIDSLTRDYLAIGDWQTRTLTSAGVGITVARVPGQGEIPPRLAEAVLPLLGETARMLGPLPGGGPVTVLIGESSGLEPIVAASPHGVLCAPGRSSTAEHTRLLASALPRLWETTRQPFGPELRRVTEAVYAYLGAQACLAARLDSPREFVSWLAAFSAEQRGLTPGLTLRQALTRGSDDPASARLCLVGGVLRAAEIDVRLREASAGARTLADALRYAFAEGLPRRTLVALPTEIEQWRASLEAWWPDAPRGAFDLGLDQGLPWFTDDILVALTGDRLEAVRAGLAPPPVGSPLAAMVSPRAVADRAPEPPTVETAVATAPGGPGAETPAGPQGERPLARPLFDPPAATSQRPAFDVDHALALLDSAKPAGDRSLLPPAETLSGGPLPDTAAGGLDLSRYLPLVALEKPMPRPRFRPDPPRAPGAPVVPEKPGPAEPGEGKPEPHKAGPVTAAPQKLVVSGLGYVVRLDPKKAPLVEVTLTVASTGEGPFSLAMPLGYAYRNVANDYVEDLVAKDAAGKEIPTAGDENGVYRWARTPKTVRYAVRLAHREEIRKLAGDSSVDSDAYEHPFLGPSNALLPGAALLLVPPGWEGAPRLRVETPRGWRVIAPWPMKDGAFEVPSASSLAHNYIGAGDWESETVEAEGLVLEAAFSRGVTVDRGIVLAGMKRLLAVQHELFGYVPTGRCCLFFTAPGDRDNLAGSTNEGSIILVLPKGGGVGEEAEVLRLLAHELMHLFENEGGELADDLRFFGEGFTEYYARVLCARAGLHSDRMVLRSFGAMFETLDSFPLGLTLERAQSDFFKDLTHARMCYYGGVARALELDVRLREASEGALCLDDLMRYIYNTVLPAQQRGGEGLSYAQWRAALDCWYPEAPKGLFDMRLTQPLPWSLSDTLDRAGLEAGFPTSASLRMTKGSVFEAIVAPEAPGAAEKQP